jgi:hypothetical protein
MNMTEECSDLVKNNANVTLNEYVWAFVKNQLIDWEWLKESDAIPTSVPMAPRHEENLVAARKQLEDAMALSDEDAKKECERYLEERRALVTRYKDLLAQAEAWQMPTSDDETHLQNIIKERIVRELSKAVREEEPAPITPEQFKRTQIRVAVEQFDDAERRYQHNVRARQGINDMLTALRNTLGNPPAAKSE